MPLDVIWTSGASEDYLKADARLAPTRAIDGLVQLLRLFPDMGAPESPTVRRVLVGRRRVYGLYYSSSPPRIIVLALADLRQDPGTIEKILRNRGIVSSGNR